MEKLECADCGKIKDVIWFYGPERDRPDPQCIECSNAFWESMGDDPHGKNWRNE